MTGNAKIIPFTSFLKTGFVTLSIVDDAFFYKMNHAATIKMPVFLGRRAENGLVNSEYYTKVLGHCVAIAKDRYVVPGSIAYPPPLFFRPRPHVYRT
jgi:hypothetical protein